jgi:hypothetical protein
MDLVWTADEPLMLIRILGSDLYLSCFISMSGDIAGSTCHDCSSHLHYIARAMIARVCAAHSIFGEIFVADILRIQFLLYSLHIYLYSKLRQSISISISSDRKCIHIVLAYQ